jgi:CheY-like chemotaxis protein
LPSRPIVALTGHARGKIRKVCLDAGMQTVLSKPAASEDLQQAIDYFV